MHTPTAGISKTSNKRKYETNKSSSSVPIPIPASFSSIPMDSLLRIEEPSSAKTSTIPQETTRGTFTNPNNMMSNSRMRNLSQRPQNNEHYLPQPSVLSQQESQGGWGSSVYRNAPNLSQSSSQQNLEITRDRERKRSSNSSSIGPQFGIIHDNYPPSTDTSLSPPISSSSFTSPQIAALAAAASYHPLWPTYRAAAAAAAAAAQAQIAAVAAAAVPNPSNSGPSAFSQPLPKSNLECATNLSNSSIHHHSSSNPSTNIQASLPPYNNLLSQTNPFPPNIFEPRSAPSSVSNARLPDTENASNLFSHYNPYHLAAAAAFASSQMVDLHRTFSFSHNMTPISTILTSQEEDMPSSTTQEHSPSVNNDGFQQPKNDEEKDYSQTLKNEKVTSTPLVKKRTSKNPYSIDAILSEDEGSSSIGSTRSLHIEVGNSTSTASNNQDLQNLSPRLANNDEMPLNTKNGLLQNRISPRNSNEKTPSSDHVDINEKMYWKSQQIRFEKEKRISVLTDNEDDAETSIVCGRKRKSSTQKNGENIKLLFKDNLGDTNKSKAKNDILVNELEDIQYTNESNVVTDLDASTV